MADVQQKKAAIEQAQAKYKLAAATIKVAEANIGAADAELAEVRAGIRRSEVDLAFQQSQMKRITGLCCMTVVAGKAARRPIEVGLSDGTRTEVTSGLSESEPVVKANAASLADGQAVVVIEPDAAEAKP